MGPSDFATYRAHISAHEARQLAKVTVSLPEVGRGGPGLRKHPTSDADLEAAYLEPATGRLACSKCSKSYRREEKTSFRKHLNYHAHKEKNYVYMCAQCSRAFTDHSNLKRHVQSVHEKQVFR
jgi:DNA-directed RNA polymerase subunit RPC12/RpoP